MSHKTWNDELACQQGKDPVLQTLGEKATAVVMAHDVHVRVVSCEIVQMRHYCCGHMVAAGRSRDNRIVKRSS